MHMSVLAMGGIVFFVYLSVDLSVTHGNFGM